MGCQFKHPGQAKNQTKSRLHQRKMNAAQSASDAKNLNVTEKIITT